MRPILTAAQMKACDTYTIETLNVPSRTLMERAARQAAEVLTVRTDLFPAGKVLLLCGSGNNGGDGFAMARELGFASLRIDTHPGNLPMQRALQKAGFTPCGTIRLVGGCEDGDERIAFEKIL